MEIIRRAAGTIVLFWPWAAEAATSARFDHVRATSPGTDVVQGDPAASLAQTLSDLADRDEGADLAIVADACALPSGWVPRIRAAAYRDDTIAAATALATGMAERTAAGEPVHPRIFRLRPSCTYLRAAVLRLVGPLDSSVTHPEAVLADFSARALSRGFSCVLADDVIVRPLGGGLAPCPESELTAIRARQPWIEAAQEEEDALEIGPLRRSLVAARAGTRSPSVTIDARAVGSAPGGTHTHQAGLVVALARSRRMTVRAVVRDNTAGEIVEAFREAGVEVLREQEVSDGTVRTDVAHRPQQVFVPEDLRLLRRVGERVVVSHLDLIAFRNPSYHVSADEWRRFRRVTRVALGAADRVVFNSEHARQDALAEELIEPRYTAVVGIGVEPTSRSATRRQPVGVPAGRELLVMIGADYMHKNRLFALELADELRRRQGWDGLLVLVGTHVPQGGSAADERALLDARPELAAHVLDLGPVSEAEKQWLLDQSRAVLCTSTYEGFGLTPLEAAAADTACLYAAHTSLREVVGEEAATIVPWDAAASADRAAPILRDGAARENHLELLRNALSRYSWASIVDSLGNVYREALHSPFRSSVPRAWEELEREQLIVDLAEAHQQLLDRVGHGLPLVDRDGLLTREQQRGIMRIATRPWLRMPLLGPVGLLGGLGADRVRSRRHAESDTRDDPRSSER